MTRLLTSSLRAASGVRGQRLNAVSITTKAHRQMMLSRWEESSRLPVTSDRKTVEGSYDRPAAAAILEEADFDLQSFMFILCLILYKVKGKTGELLKASFSDWNLCHQCKSADKYRWTII